MSQPDDAAFSRAIWRNDLAAVAEALSAGRDPNRRTGSGTMTPLMEAAAAGQEAIALRLLDAGADPLAETPQGEDALVSLCRSSHASGPLASRLITAGADPNGRDQHGTALLYLAADRGNLDAVRALLEAGAAPDGVPERGQIPLQAAARRGHDDIITALLAGGAAVDHRATPRGLTALMEALGCRREAAARALLAAGAAVDAAFHETPVVHPEPILCIALGGMDDLYYDRSAPPRPSEALLLELIDRGAADSLTDDQLARAMQLAGARRLRRVVKRLRHRPEGSRR